MAEIWVIYCSLDVLSYGKNPSLFQVTEKGLRLAGLIWRELALNQGSLMSQITALENGHFSPGKALEFDLGEKVGTLILTLDSLHVQHTVTLLLRSPLRTVHSRQLFT